MSSQAQDASYTISTERQNFARICLVLVDICTFIMRDILRQEIPESQFSTELAKNQQQSKGKIKFNSSQRAILFPEPSKAYSGYYSDFDITLLYTLLRNLCAGIQPHRNGWGYDPDPADRSTSANIERLRLLRNAQFGHLSDASVSVADFQTNWKHIRQIVVDFEQVLLPVNKSIKGSYTDKVDDLEKNPLDPSLQMKYISLLKKQTYIEDDFKNIKDDLKTQANRITLLEECNADRSIKSRVDYLEEHSKRNKAVRTDSIKQNVTANTKARLKSHANNACYTSTVAVDATLDALSDKQIASITGRAGAGKTTAALEVMRRLSDESSTTEPAIPAIIDEAVNWDTVINCNNKTVVLLDDPFGKTNFDQSNYDRWERKFDSIVSCVEMGKVSVIFVVRSNIFEEFHDNIKNHRIIEKVKVINFSMMSEASKSKMLNKYLNFYGRTISSSDSEKIKLTNPYYGFPQTCFLFCKNQTLFDLGAEFFIRPDVSLRNEMEHLRESRNNTQKCQYSVLVYILLYKSINATTISMAKMMKIGNYIQIKTILITDIEEAIKSLLGIYLKESLNGYEFYHTTILEAVFLSFGYLSPTMVFQNCSENILYEMVKAPGYQLKENEIGLIMQKSDISVLVDRFLSTDQYEKENRFLVYLSNVCRSLLVEEIPSILSKHVSVKFKFFMACRFGKSELVTKYLSKSKPDFIQRVKMAVSSTPAKYSLSDVIIKYGLELAVVCNHLSTVKILIQNDKKLLLFCVDNNWFELIETIIRDDPSMVHFSKYDKDTLMLYAARKNRLEITKCLYEQGKNIRSRLETKHMLHFICIQNDWLEILENLLLKDPALINLKDSDGRSPICYAGFLKRKNMVKFLQRFNPKVTERDNWGKSLIHYCVENNWYDVLRTLTPDKHLLVKLLYEECKPLIWYAVLILDESVYMFQGIVSCHLHDSCGKTLLHKCVDNGWYDLLEKLVNDNPTVADVRDANGNPLICYVARENKKQVVMFLIKFYCDVKQTDSLGKTLLHYCIDNDWNDILDRLFKNNHSLVNAKDKFGDPLICYASKRSKKDVVVMMCHRNVDVKQYNFWGKTVLHYCVDNDWVDILEYIIERDPDLVYFAKSCKEEDSLIYYAHRSNAKFIVEYLLRQNAKGTFPISISYTLLYVCIDNYLFDRIVDLLKTEPKLVDKEHTLYGLLPIGYAARKRNKSMVEHLIKCNANVTLRDRCGKSVLHYCVENGWYDVIRTLHSNIRSLIEILYHEGEPLLWYASRIIDDSTCKYPYEGNVDGHLHDSSGKSLLHKCVDNHWYVLLRNMIKDSPTVVNVRDSMAIHSYVMLLDKTKSR